MSVRSSHYLFLLIITCAVLLSTAQTVSACSCGPRPTVLDAFEATDEVAIVRVLAVEKAEASKADQYVGGVKTATLIVEKVFKGKLKARDEIVFGQGGGADCVWTFSEKSIGRQYLFYLTRPEKFSERRYLPSKEPGLWFAFGCGRSTSLTNATDDLLFLENLKTRRGQTRISGSIGGGFEHPDIDVEAKKIKFIGKDKTYETRTDKNGFFEIYDLPQGQYSVEPEMATGWKIDPLWLKYSPSVVGIEYGKPEMKAPNQVEIMLAAKRHASVDIVFTIDNRVRGRVISPKGKPMDRVCVYMVRSRAESGGLLMDCTDVQGRFEISSIPAGEYVLVANQDGKPSSDEPFAKIFYPNVSERDRAARINVRAGDSIDNLDFVIPKLAETITVEGTLRYADGRPVSGEWVKFKIDKPDSIVDNQVTKETDNEGRFTLKILKGLTGELAGEYWLIQGLFKNCPKVDEIIAKSGKNYVTVQSNVVKLTTEQDMFGVELTLPFPLCQKAKE